MPLYLDSGVGSLFRLLLKVLPGSKVFAPNFEATSSCLTSFYDSFGARSKQVTAIIHNGSENQPLIDLLEEEDSYEFKVDPRIEVFVPPKEFHYSFCLPHFKTNYDNKPERLSLNTGHDIQELDLTDYTPPVEISPVTVQDSLLRWEASKNNPTDRSAEVHLITVESMLTAIAEGGYMGAVLPKRWIGRNMQFYRWFCNYAANVAKIALPKGAVHCKVGSHSLPVENDWFLYVWTKQMPEESIFYNTMKHAGFRWSPFIWTLRGLDEDSIARCCRSFRLTDWYNNHVSIWNELLVDSLEYHSLYGLNCHPPALPDTSNIRILTPSLRSKLDFKVFENFEEIDKLTVAEQAKLVQMIPGPPIKCLAFSDQAEAALLDIITSEGTVPDKNTGMLVNRYDVEIGTKNFSQAKEYLLRCMQERGLVPFVLQSDVKKIRHQEVWLNRQLTPIERTIKVPVDEEEAKSKAKDTDVDDNGNGHAEVWEELYEDVGMKATQGQVLNQWRQRALKMKINNPTFEFQFDDIAIMCCKDGMFNSNKMGLGKTFETLFTALLRDKKRCLIVVPSKIIGEWQEQIEKNLTMFARKVKRNWRDQPIKTDYQVIQYAKQCRIENLKTFNLISYENLWATPKDSIWFRCPSCNRVACSPMGNKNQNCQMLDPVTKKHTCNRIGAWREKNKEQKLRKYVYHVNSEVRVYARLWTKMNHIDVAQLQKFLEARPELSAKVKGDSNPDSWRIVDHRPIKPTMITMTPQKKRFKKMYEKIVGYENKRGLYGMERVPVTEYRPRRPHLKWSFSELLRHRFTMIAIDEAIYIKNEETNRAKALWHLKSKVRYALTGTIIRGNPKNIINIVNWTLKKQVFPDYRNRAGYNGVAAFLKKYGTYVTILETGQKKLLPKISNAELFQTELSPFLLRHVNAEPLVRKDIPLRIPKIHTVMLDLEDNHREYYALWLKKFKEWWEKKRLEVDHEISGGQRENLIAKITYLINAATMPHWMFHKFLEIDKKTGQAKDPEGMMWAKVIGPYKGPMTSKQLYTFKLVKHAKMVGDKIMIGSIRRKNLEFGKQWCDRQQNKIYSLVLHGGISNKVKVGSNRSSRQELVNKFRHQDYDALWCGLTAASEGMNIPEANRVIVMDYSWEPTEQEQFIARVNRPQQTKKIQAWLLAHKGTIEEYMMMVNILKANSAAEGVDYMEFAMTTEMIPDIRQYADAIVDGTETIMKAKMKLAVDEILKRKEIGDDE